jgi:hypothetical protein
MHSWTQSIPFKDDGDDDDDDADDDADADNSTLES